MKRRSQDDSGHVDETWLIPYADLLTLLLALFIVLFAASVVDEAKMSEMATAFYTEYNGLLPDPMIGDPGIGGIGAGSDFIPQQASGGDDPETIIDFFATQAPNRDKPGEGSMYDDETLQAIVEANEKIVGELVSELQDSFTSYIELNGLDSEMSLEIKEDGLLITLTSDVWFASGSAEINEPQSHTDNVPMTNVWEYANNWELSVARAVNFMQELMYASTLQPDNFSARGFGEYEPIDTNETPEGRQRNRRVEVMISPDVAMIKPAD